MKTIKISWKIMVLCTIAIFTLLSVACDQRNPTAEQIELWNREPGESEETPEAPTELVSSFEIDSIQDVLYEDNGATSVRLRVQVRDINGFPVPSYNVQFRTVPTVIEQIRIDPFLVTTDEAGVALTSVSVRGLILPSGEDSMDITIGAFINYPEPAPDLIPLLKREITLQVCKIPDVVSVDLSTTALVPGSITSVQKNAVVPFVARPLDSQGNTLPDGSTMVTFTSVGDLGRFKWVNPKSETTPPEERSEFFTITVPINDGKASVEWIAGTKTGQTTIYASVNHIQSERSYSAEVMAGVPTRIIWERQFTDTNVNTPVTLSARVTDRDNNATIGQIVNFSTDIGTVTPSSLMTDNEGLFTVSFNPGVAAGEATISATSGDSASADTKVRILSKTVHSIRFDQTSAINLNVAGTSGIESAVISVTLYDMQENIVTGEDIDIRFTIERAPMGVSLNNNPYFFSPVSTVVKSTAGQAFVAVSSGFMAGIVELNAVVVGSFPLVSARRANIIVHAGPPAVAEVFVPHQNVEERYGEVGAGIWWLEIAAKLSDQSGNPVSNGVGVMFEIDRVYKPVWDHILGDPANPNSGYHNVNNYNLATAVAPDSVSIIASAYVGNVSAAGDSTAGHAYTRIFFHGRLSNRTIGVTVTTAGQDHNGEAVEFKKTTFIKLPMLDVWIDVYPRTGNIVMTNFPVFQDTGDFLIDSFNGAFLGPDGNRFFYCLGTRDGVMPPPINNGVDLTPAERQMYQIPLYWAATWEWFDVVVKDRQNNPIWNAPIRFTLPEGGLFTNQPRDTVPWLNVNGTPVLDAYEGRTNMNGELAKKFYEYTLFTPPPDQGSTPWSRPVMVTLYAYGATQISKQIQFTIFSWNHRVMQD